MELFSGETKEIPRLQSFEIYLMMVTVRRSTPAEFEQVRAFYADQGYSQALRPGDRYFLAEQEGVLCGICRLCAEQDIFVLRGMRVAPEYRRQGIGRALLRAVEAFLEGQTCYCLPYRYLRDFYGQIGFYEISPETAPEFLSLRLRHYIEDYQLEVILMRRNW